MHCGIEYLPDGALPLYECSHQSLAYVIAPDGQTVIPIDKPVGVMVPLFEIAANVQSTRKAAQFFRDKLKGMAKLLRNCGDPKNPFAPNFLCLVIRTSLTGFQMWEESPEKHVIGTSWFMHCGMAAFYMEHPEDSGDAGHFKFEMAVLDELPDDETTYPGIEHEGQSAIRELLF